jgi:hypothetical protein
VVLWERIYASSCSYWDFETSGQQTFAGGGEGKTTSKLKLQSDFMPVDLLFSGIL